MVCLQELKATDREFPHAAIDKAGYGAVWRGQKSWNGVAILARGAEPIVTRNELPGDAGDDAGALYRGGGQRRADHLALRCRTAIRSPDRNSPTSSPGWTGLQRMPRICLPPTCRSCSPATTTSCRPIAISIRPSPMTRTRCCSRRAARALRALLGQGWRDADPHAASVTSRCTPTGATCATAGRATPGLRIDHLLLSRAGGQAPRRRRRRPRRSRRGQCQRPCAGLDRVGGRHPLVPAKAGTQAGFPLARE